LTLCYQRIQRQGAAQKCLGKALVELERVLGEGSEDLEQDNSIRKKQKTISLSTDASAFEGSDLAKSCY
jgi:hypothetical protein